MCESIKQKLSHSEESFISRYGYDPGKRKWEEYCKKLSRKNSLEAFIAKGKNKNDFELYNKSRAVTLENLTLKYGEIEGKLRFERYKEKQRDAGNTLQYFVSLYGDELGAIKYAEVCKSKGITLDNMVRVHGKEQGFIKYNSWLEKTKGNYVSLSGKQFIKDIVEYLPNHFIFHDSVYGKEFCIYDEKLMMFDFVITSPVKKAVEFNGDYWHANPKKYKEDDLVPLRGGPIKAGEIWKRDSVKINALEKRGFDVYVVWENEYLQNPDEIVRKVIEWITH